MGYTIYAYTAAFDKDILARVWQENKSGLANFKLI